MLSPSQQRFVNLLTENKKNINLMGPAGTGKTYVLSHWFRTLPEAIQKRTVFLSPTHRACEVLRKALGNLICTVKTTDSFLGLQETVHPETLEISYRPPGSWELFDAKGKILQSSKSSSGETWKYVEHIQFGERWDVDYVIQDESSMLADTSNRGRKLLEICKARDIRLVLCGDPLQLPPVGEETIFPNPKFETVTLTEQHRGNHEDVRALYSILRTSVQEHLQPSLENTDHVKVIQTLQLNKDTPLILAHTNRKVDTYNFLMRKKLYGAQAMEENFLPGEKIVTNCMLGTIPNGTELVVKAVRKAVNEMNIHVVKLEVTKVNGVVFDHLITVADENYPEDLIELRKQIQALRRKAKAAKSVQVKKAVAQQIKAMNMMQPHVIKYSYAMTVYKSQGSTYDDVIVDYDDIVSCGREQCWRLLYVASTRARKNITIIAR